MRIILASASPRRRELLAQIGLEFEIKVSEVQEKLTSAEPGEAVRELAAQKAEAVWRSVRADGGTWPEELLVIGADTVVSCDGAILGKPADEEDAKRMLRSLSGRSHVVYTGVALICCAPGKTPETRTFCEATTVHFAPMTEDEIDIYVATGDPLDKAGAYGIQGFCARYITGIEGDYNNVVGLPVGRLYREIKQICPHIMIVPIGGAPMRKFDDAVLECFLENQCQLFPQPVAETPDEAEDFLEECMAVVVNSADEVLEYFEEEGIDVDGAVDEEILEADEVFDVGDGRYLIVEG